MKREKLIQHLRYYGCVLFREGSRHSIFYNPHNGKTSAVPRHHEIKRFTALNIFKDLEVPIPKEK